MANLWCKDQAAQWQPVRLEEESLPLAQGETASAVSVCRAHGARLAETWVLLCGGRAKVRVNGLVLHTGIRVLADRDEITVGSGEPVFFSTEELARVETFAAGKAVTPCPRCKKPVDDGAQVVRCPQCKLAYHYSSDKQRDCWGYSPTCACGHPTAMDAGFRWTPHEMWE